MSAHKALTDVAALARGTREVPATAQCQITPDVVGEELNQLITKHLGPKANLFDYSDAVEALLASEGELVRLLRCRRGSPGSWAQAG